MDSVYTNSTAVPNSITSALNNSEHWPCFQNLAGAAFFAGMELLTAAVGFPANVMVLWVLLQRKNTISSSKSLRQSGSGQEEVHPFKKKAFKTVFTIFIISLVFYFPLVAIYPFKSYFNPVVFKCYLRPVCSSFAMPSSSIQPLLYLYNAGKLTRAQFPCCAVPSPSP
ncbi:UNVERIFIED_CONTAM: hypothetical protein FKN15_039014 [Acipenser sinensis]